MFSKVSLFRMQKIKENFISFRNKFLKYKERVKWSNNMVKTKDVQLLLKLEFFAIF